MSPMVNTYICLCHLCFGFQTNLICTRTFTRSEKHLCVFVFLFVIATLTHINIDPQGETNASGKSQDSSPNAKLTGVPESDTLVPKFLVKFLNRGYHHCGKLMFSCDFSLFFAFFVCYFARNSCKP